MIIERYRRVLAIPGTPMLLVVGVLARIPVFAASLTLTLHVVGDMKLGFLQAGLVGAASTGGQALGAPLAGRFIDRHGLRPVVAVTTAAQLFFWPSAALLPYWPLLAGAFCGGVLGLPVPGIIRQCLAAAVPVEHRRTAFALDSTLLEVSYMVGPAVAVTAITTVGSGWSLALIGLGLTGSGTALLLSNPQTRTEGAAEPDGGSTSRRRWLTPALLVLLAVTFAAVFTVAAAELSMVAVLKAESATRWTGLALALFGMASLVGGLTYGALRRGFSPLAMIGVMAALTVPIGLVGPWPLLCLAMVPAGMLCAPTLSTTIDILSRQVPSASRGKAVGLHSTALTLGLTTAGPVTGSIIDAWGTRWSFALTGIAALAIVALIAPAWRRASRPTGQPAEQTTGQPAGAAA